MSEVDGKGGDAVIDSLKSIVPDLGKFIIEFAFGDIYSRVELSLQERELITISSLITVGGCEPQLKANINGALNTCVPPEKIIEAFIQCVLYTGSPKVLNAVFTAKEVFKEGNITI